MAMEHPPQTSSKNVFNMTIDWCGSHWGFVLGWTTGLILSIIYMVLV